VVLWDFDGTLVEGPGGSSWTGCLYEVVSRHAPELGVSLESVRAFRGVFPWHSDRGVHPELCDPDAWWTHVGALIRRTYLACGASTALAAALEREVRCRYGDPSSYRVLGDAVLALEAMRSAGWRNMIVSNHGPDLPAIVGQLTIGPLVERVFSSALTGFEKPHPQAFQTALAAAGNPAALYMVGDNPAGDIEGAAGVGIPGILVHAEEDGSPTLLNATELMLTNAN
jgi:putative hydrolase of the HAD superfamily